MITVLIRTHPGREELVKRAIWSVENEYWSYEVYNGEKVNDYSYNLYCNELKQLVGDGWFMFLDSDDVLIPGSLAKIIPYLQEDKALIVQMLRNGRPKPRNGLIERGKIGMPCMILHSKWKDLADVGDKYDSDYQWIKDVTDKIGYEFVPIPVVDAGSRSHGK